MEWIKLIGILIIVLGFILKLDTIATVVVAGLATALVSGKTFYEFLEMIGQAFTDNRLVTLFLITLPLVGLSEQFGLKSRAMHLIKSIKGLTVGTFYSVYLLIRLIAGAFSIRLGGHPQFVRPLVAPMGEAAAEAEMGSLSKEELDKLKAQAAANDNFGNFFGQNTFAGASGVLLIGGTLTQLGYDGSNLIGIATSSVAIAVITLIVGTFYNRRFNKKLLKNVAANKQNKGGENK